VSVVLKIEDLSVDTIYGKNPIFLLYKMIKSVIIN